MFLKVFEMVKEVIGPVPIEFEFIYCFCTIFLFLFIVYAIFVLPYKLILGKD